MKAEVLSIGARKAKPRVTRKVARRLKPLLPSKPSPMLKLGLLLKSWRMKLLKYL
jgi:hypothetical protein